MLQPEASPSLPNPDMGSVVGYERMLNWTLNVSLNCQEETPAVSELASVPEILERFDYGVSLVREPKGNSREGWIRFTKQIYKPDLRADEWLLGNIPVALDMEVLEPDFPKESASKQELSEYKDEKDYFDRLIDAGCRLAAKTPTQQDTDTCIIEALLNKLGEWDTFFLNAEDQFDEQSITDVEFAAMGDQLDQEIQRQTESPSWNSNTDILPTKERRKFTGGRLALASLALLTTVKVAGLFMSSDSKSQTSVATSENSPSTIAKQANTSVVPLPGAQKEAVPQTTKPETTAEPALSTTTTAAPPAITPETTVPASTTASLPPVTAAPPEVVQPAPRPLPSEAEAQQEVTAYADQTNMSNILDHIHVDDGRIAVNVTSRNYTTESTFCVEYVYYDWNNPSFIYETLDSNGNVVSQERVTTRERMEVIIANSQYCFAMPPPPPK